MPKSRAKELQCRHAWEKAAGGEIASRLRFLRMSGRTVVLGCEEADWSHSVRSLLPRAAARFASRIGGGRIRRFRVVALEENGTFRTVEEGRIEQREPVPPAGSGPAGKGRILSASPSVADIREVAARYLARHGKKQGEHVDGK